MGKTTDKQYRELLKIRLDDLDTILTDGCTDQTAVKAIMAQVTIAEKLYELEKEKPREAGAKEKYTINDEPRVNIGGLTAPLHIAQQLHDK